MHEKYLTFEQNLCAARIFLNTFGLTLENANDINESSKLKIFDKVQEVGELHFNNDKIMMSANYNDSMLEASFDSAKTCCFADIESGNALFGQWSSEIFFQIQKQNDIKLSGEFLIGSSVDSEFGISCLCHPLINCEIANKGNITLKILRDGRTFGLEIDSGNYNETIDISPWSDFNGFIKHIITNDKYNPKRYENEYRKYMGIFSSGGENEDKLKIFSLETEWGKEISSRIEFVPKNGDDESEALVIQKGMLMQDLDPDMFDKIKKLREILLIGDISLLDNLVSVCYDSYTDEELSALLDLKRQKMYYQDGSDSLINSYFGIGKNSCFFSREEHKRLLKKF